MVAFSQANSVTPLFYSIFLSKIRLYMIYLNLKTFSLFNFEIFRLIHYLQSDFRRLNGTVQDARFAHYFIGFIFTAVLRRFTVLLFFYHKNNAYISLLVITLLK